MRYFVAAALLLITSTASAESLRFILDVFDEQSILFTSNAVVDNNDGVLHWRVVDPLLQGEVAYHFEVPDRIQSVRLWNRSYLSRTPPQRFMSVFTSVDGENWKQVAHADAKVPIYGYPFDVSEGLAGSKDIYVKATFFGKEVRAFENHGPNASAILFVETVLRR